MTTKPRQHGFQRNHWGAPPWATRLATNQPHHTLPSLHCHCGRYSDVPRKRRKPRHINIHCGVGWQDWDCHHAKASVDRRGAFCSVSLCVFLSFFLCLFVCLFIYLSILLNVNKHILITSWDWDRIAVHTSFKHVTRILVVYSLIFTTRPLRLTWPLLGTPCSRYPGGLPWAPGRVTHGLGALGASAGEETLRSWSFLVNLLGCPVVGS